MKLWIVTVVAALAIACEVTPVAQEETENPTVKLEKLFEHEGCKVFRFRDVGKYVYWANCRGMVRSDHPENCGKNCTHVVEDPSFTTAN